MQNKWAYVCNKWKSLIGKCLTNGMCTETNVIDWNKCEWKTHEKKNYQQQKQHHTNWETTKQTQGVSGRLIYRWEYSILNDDKIEIEMHLHHVLIWRFIFQDEKSIPNSGYLFPKGLTRMNYRCKRFLWYIYLFFYCVCNCYSCSVYI